MFSVKIQHDAALVVWLERPKERFLDIAARQLTREAVILLLRDRVGILDRVHAETDTGLASRSIRGRPR
jgi:hypothetical protein